jgi:hypothetical protein
MRINEEVAMKHKAIEKIVLTMIFLVHSVAWGSTTLYVSGVNGSDSNTCLSPSTACKTIGHAISLATSGDAIKVAATTYTENLTIGLSLRILGSGAKTTIVDGGGVGTVFIISSTTAHVTVSGLTIRNGWAPLGFGGGIRNSGTLRMIATTISANRASFGCTQYCFARGGGILNSGTLTISSSTVSGNVAWSWCHGHCQAFGGGIYNTGKLTITNSTLSGNTAHAILSNLGIVNNSGIGGAIVNTGTLIMNNTTLSQNTAYWMSGGIENGGSTTLQNTIIANNMGGNCGSPGSLISLGYNLSSDGTCGFSGPGDLNNIDPMLGPLQYNGGPTQTMALPSGSPAIDTGNPNGCTDGQGHLLKTDQRGMTRPDQEDTSGCDMGAYESQSD